MRVFFPTMLFPELKLKSEGTSVSKFVRREGIKKKLMLGKNSTLEVQLNLSFSGVTKKN